MSATDEPQETEGIKQNLSRPARKQVKPGQVNKDDLPQTGKEYSTLPETSKKVEYLSP